MSPFLIFFIVVAAFWKNPWLFQSSLSICYPPLKSAFATSATLSFRKSFEDALENLSIEESQLHQQLELQSSNDTVQLTLTALAPSLRELPRSLASRGALALRRRLATLHRGIRQLCQQNATPQRPKRPPDNVAWIPHKRGKVPWWKGSFSKQMLRIRMNYYIYGNIYIYIYR